MKSPSSSARPNNAIGLLKADHRMVEDLFSQIEASGDSDELIELVVALQTALSVHARIEEEVFYPAVRAAVGEAADLLDEAWVEHASLKHLLVDISTSTDDDQYHRARIKVLKEYVKHHVKEEEEQLMPMAESANIDLEAIGALLGERRQALLAALEPGIDGGGRQARRGGARARAPH